MIDRRALINAASARREAADWTIVEREQQIAIADDTLRRVERRTGWQLTLHVDAPEGRGSAHVKIDAIAAEADEVVDRAIGLALAALGPSWRSAAPAAPAKVTLLDPALAGDPLETAVKLHRPGRRITVTHEQVAVVARSGFRTEWVAGEVRLTAPGIDRRTRRVSELDLAAAVDLVPGAKPPVAGPCAVVLGTEAMLHGDGLGVWQTFVTQADAIVERQGLTRYREGAPIAPGADQVPEPLTITSDGALELGLLSAPVGDEAEAVRRFSLVERGVAAGLGLTPREAALRHRAPNGGVRNLVIAPGSWGGATQGRTIEVRRLRFLAIDPYTGHATLEIAHGIDGSTVFTGGTLRLDLIAALARARRSVGRTRRGAYVGPASVLIEHADLIV